MNKRDSSFRRQRGIPLINYALECCHYLTIEKARDDIRLKRSSGEKWTISILLRGGNCQGNYYIDRKEGILYFYTNDELKHLRPLSVEDAKAYIEVVTNTQVTTYMICSGSDYPYYRSKYGREFGDDRNGTLDCGLDTANQE